MARFQFTQPVRAATCITWYALCQGDFNSRSPCELRPALPAGYARCGNFNSRSPCELRQRLRPRQSDRKSFQFTQPVRAATAAKSKHLITFSVFLARRPYLFCRLGRIGILFLFFFCPILVRTSRSTATASPSHQQKVQRQKPGTGKG